MSQEFRREARYAVFKFSKLNGPQSKILQDAMCKLPRMSECLVIESDWPEYEVAWAMIKARVSDEPLSLSLPHRMIKTERSSDEYDMHADAHNACLDQCAQVVAGLRAEIQRQAEQFKEWQAGHHANYVKAADERDRLQAESAALQQRLNVADQRNDDLQHQLSQSLEVNPHSLRVVLTALVGAPHEIRELQVCRGMPDNPIDQLLREYNAWTETPEPATPQ